ncbi:MULTISPECIES: hypothetical protein [Sorangium]|uniref:Uncharacterized protein n=1 Tax=Sorangium cellulosum TaxID=56 RepID=A0A4P2QYI3_SORCE|nr:MULTISPECIES: hypothetical protein [Sorangium]AUX35348.1 hypothetical protein SOCE836_075390 [Sorangium cellulosum]WCQ94652.1 hypothetical protein NQZ70_07420 [Sorangium sp. Soce836]
MRSMPDAATYVLPALSIGLAALVFLGPGAQRMATGVRVWGAPVAGSEALALRIEGVRRLHGADDPAALPEIEVSATSAGAPLAGWSGSTGKDGIGEALLRAGGGLKAPVVVRILRGGDALLEQEVPLSPPLPTADASALPGAADASPLPGAAQGELRLRVTVARGAMAAPFPEPVRVTVETEDGAPVPGARVEASAVGADLGEQGSGPAQITADARGAAELTIRPLAHNVELTLRAARPGSAPPGARGAGGAWEGRLPVIPGAIWLDPAGLAGERPELRLTSPAPKPHAYVSIGGAHGRLLGAVVPLAADGGGFFSGTLALPDGQPPGAAGWAVVASDPYERGAGTVAWPLSPAASPVAPRRVALLADGVPAAEARERARASRARRAGLLVLGAAGVAEMLLLALRARTARRRLAAHLAAASGGEGEDGTDGAPLSREDRGRLLATVRAEPILSVLALAALVGLSFAAVAALATFR